jgi:hypothetical protein
MASLPMSFGASMPLRSPHHFVPFVSVGGECTPLAGRSQLPTGATRYGCQGSMAPSPITSGATRLSPISAHPFCRLGLLPPTLYQRWGGAPPRWHVVPWLELTRHTPRPLPPLQINFLCQWCNWHTPSISCQLHRGAKNRQPLKWLPSMPLFPPSSTGINDTPFVDTLHGKPGNALLPQQSSAGKGASGSITGSPSRPYNARNASASSCCVAVHRHTLCRFAVIANHLPPQPTKPPTQRSFVIPSGILVCRYHKGGRLDETIVLVVAWVKGIGPVLPILEGGRCVCPFVSGQHRLRWQHRVFFGGPGGQNLHPTSLPTLLPQVSNMPAAFILSKEIVVSCLVSVVPTPHAQAAPTLLTSLLPNKMPTTTSN